MICAIVLAAGRSRRMGTQKLLLPWQGRPLLAHIVDTVLRSRVDETYVVVGVDAPRLQAALAGRPVQWVTLPPEERDMLDSVRAGLRALPAPCAAALVVLGDQPTLTAALLDRLLAVYAASGRRIVVPTYGGRRGHPLLFARSLQAEILERFEGVGLRGLLQAHPDDVGEVAVAERGVLEDLDRPEDLPGGRAPWAP